MAELNYTKGEWKLEQAQSGSLLVVSGNKTIAKTPQATNIEDAQEVLANATLIKTAPDMYKALTAIYYFARGYTEIPKDEIANFIRPILLKADGWKKEE